MDGSLAAGYATGPLIGAGLYKVSMISMLSIMCSAFNKTVTIVYSSTIVAELTINIKKSDHAPHDKTVGMAYTSKQ